MLAQNFMTAADLGLTTAQRDALISVLGMLERGELKQGFFDNRDPDGSVFSMSGYLFEWGCQTVGCIAGWAHISSGRKIFPWVVPGCPSDCFDEDLPEELIDLFFAQPRPKDVTLSDVTIAQAATALRNYLTTGRAEWKAVLG